MARISSRGAKHAAAQRGAFVRPKPKPAPKSDAMAAAFIRLAAEKSKPKK